MTSTIDSEDPRVSGEADGDHIIHLNGRTPRSPRDRRRRRTLVGGALLVVATIGIGTMVASHGDAPQSVEQPAADLETAPVVRGKLRGSIRLPGNLSYAGARTIPAGADGVVVDLAKPGTVLGQGSRLTLIGSTSTYLMFGKLPAWRAFEAGMSDGFDVAQLENDLKALGYFSGEPDAHFSSSTRKAIEAWQRATGQERTGAIPLGGVVFAPEARRVAEAKVAIGDTVTASTPALVTTSTTRHITADVALAHQQLATPGAAVSIELPDGTTVDGTIVDAGAPVKRENSEGQTSTVVPITVGLSDPEAAKQVTQGTVGLEIEKTSDGDVLYVPVGALVATDADHFAVQVVGPDGVVKTVPVETGAFMAGNVEISGKGLHANQKVVVPS